MVEPTKSTPTFKGQSEPKARPQLPKAPTGIQGLNEITAGEHNHNLYILKSRGMAHPNQMCEFLTTDHGVELREARTGG